MMNKNITNYKLNKSEIIEILGQPSTKSTFSDNIWYYIFFIQKEKHIFSKKFSNKILKIKFDDKQNVETYNIIKNNQSIKIKTVKVNSDTSVFNRGIARELLDSFIRRMEEPTN